MSSIPIQFRSDEINVAELEAFSGDFSNALTVGGIPVSLSGHSLHGSGEYTASISIPSGSNSHSFTFSGIGNDYTYLYTPQVIGTMRFSDPSNVFYGYSTYNVTISGFSVGFTDTILETGHFLDLVVRKDPS